MELEYAELVLKELERENGVQLKLSEIMDMEKIPSDNQNVYAYHKGDITILVMVYIPYKVVTVKFVKWK